MSGASANGEKGTEGNINVSENIRKNFKNISKKVLTKGALGSMIAELTAKEVSG